MRKILIIGGAGYVGSALVSRLLLTRNYEVTVFDTFWYGDIRYEPCTNITGDIRDANMLRIACQGQDVIIHLACISNDPSMDLNPRLGREINLDAFDNVLNAVRTAKPQRFIYASSSSVYGLRKEKLVVESTPCTPLTDYSRYKLLCEERLRSESLPGVASTILRPATVAGYSARMRFDLAPNAMTISALVKGEIKIHGGPQKRPIIHIDDITRAYQMVCEAPIHDVIGQTFNVGGTNISLSDMAEDISDALPRSVLKETHSTSDLRSYHIDSRKISRALGFRPVKNLQAAVWDLERAYREEAFTNPLTNPKYYNILRMKELNLT